MKVRIEIHRSPEALQEDHRPATAVSNPPSACLEPEMGHHELEKGRARHSAHSLNEHPLPFVQKSPPRDRKSLPASICTAASLSGEMPRAIESALTNSTHRATRGRYHMAKVVFPDPFGPPIT